MNDINEFFPLLLGIMFVGSLLALGWMHWYSTQQSKFLRELEQQREQRRQPAE